MARDIVIQITCDKCGKKITVSEDKEREFEEYVILELPKSINNRSISMDDFHFCYDCVDNLCEWLDER